MRCLSFGMTFGIETPITESVDALLNFFFLGSNLSRWPCIPPLQIQTRLRKGMLARSHAKSVSTGASGQARVFGIPDCPEDRIVRHPQQRVVRYFGLSIHELASVRLSSPAKRNRQPHLRRPSIRPYLLNGCWTDGQTHRSDRLTFLLDLGWPQPKQPVWIPDE